MHAGAAPYDHPVYDDSGTTGMASTMESLRYSEFPIQRLLQLASSPFQIGFARQVMRVLEPSSRVAHEATHDGLLVFAANEEVLLAQTGVLACMYGDGLVAGPPRVRRLSLGRRLYEPVMRLRVCVERRHLAAVRQDLDARGARRLDERPGGESCELEAEALLQDLLGYGAALAALGAPSARHSTALDRYVPVSRPPGDQAA